MHGRGLVLFSILSAFTLIFCSFLGASNRTEAATILAADPSPQTTCFCGNPVFRVRASDSVRNDFKKKCSNGYTESMTQDTKPCVTEAAAALAENPTRYCYHFGCRLGGERGSGECKDESGKPIPCERNNVPNVSLPRQEPPPYVPTPPLKRPEPGLPYDPFPTTPKTAAPQTPAVPAPRIQPLPLPSQYLTPAPAIAPQIQTGPAFSANPFVLAPAADDAANKRRIQAALQREILRSQNIDKKWQTPFGNYNAATQDTFPGGRTVQRSPSIQEVINNQNQLWSDVEGMMKSLIYFPTTDLSGINLGSLSNTNVSGIPAANSNTEGASLPEKSGSTSLPVPMLGAPSDAGTFQSQDMRQPNTATNNAALPLINQVRQILQSLLSVLNRT